MRKIISVFLFYFVLVINVNSKIKRNKFSFAASSGQENIKSSRNKMFLQTNKTELSKKVNELFEISIIQKNNKTNQIQIESVNLDNPIITKTSINSMSLIGSGISLPTNNTTISDNFLHEFSLSFSLNFFSEIGDKSFVSIILIYDQISPIILFFVASSMEILMNFFSVAIGYQLRTHPIVKLICQLSGTITAVVFSVLLIIEIISTEEEDSTVDKSFNEDNFTHENISPIEIKEETKFSLSSLFSINYFLKILNVAWIIFMSELGDKSQITTIILSTEYNPCAIFLGTAFAHVLGIILSMTIGYFISNHTNKKILNAFGAICFLYFGLQIGMGFYNSGGFKALLNSY